MTGKTLIFCFGQRELEGIDTSNIVCGRRRKEDEEGLGKSRTYQLEGSSSDEDPASENREKLKRNEKTVDTLESDAEKSETNATSTARSSKTQEKPKGTKAGKRKVSRSESECDSGVGDSEEDEESRGPKTDTGTSDMVRSETGNESEEEHHVTKTGNEDAEAGSEDSSGAGGEGAYIPLSSKAKQGPERPSNAPSDADDSAVDRMDVEVRSGKKPAKRRRVQALTDDDESEDS